MENQNQTPSPEPYSWYDDRVTVLPEEEEPELEWSYNTFKKETYDTPPKIYGYLDQHVWKQDAAKRAASVIVYNCFERGVKSNAIFIGPTGCGKTHIWRCLKDIFPDRIEIVDGSNVTLDGWKGDKTWKSLLRSPIFRSVKKTILVIDEADKMLSPKIASGGENVSHSVQGESLTMLEGSKIEIKENNITHQIDTSRISFVLCGAFSVKARDMAEKEAGSRIGFGAAPTGAKAYGKPLTEADLIGFGVMPEFMGRIQRIVNLEPLTTEDYYRITGDMPSFLQRINRQYRTHVELSNRTRHELAEAACSSGLGIRGMENRIRAMLDDAIFEDCGQRCYRF